MATYLISKVEAYRADTESEATNLIEGAKKSRDYTLVKYSRDYKEKKQKGDVVDSWYKVSLTKVFDDEKEPAGLPIREEIVDEQF